MPTMSRLKPAARTIAGLLVSTIFILPLFWAVIASLRQPGLPPALTIEWWPQADRKSVV